MVDGTELPDERPQRRREYSGAGATLGVAILVVVAVAAAVWWFEVRGSTGGSGADNGYGVVALAPTENPTGQPPAAESGRAAPNFRLPGLDGGDVTLTGFRGRYVLLNFWASWCGPCRGETPDLQALSERHAATLTVVGVNQQESAGAARSFARDFDLTYPIVLDRDGGVSLAYRVGRGLPVSLLLDREGVVRAVYVGRLSAADLAAIERQVAT